MTLPAKQPRPKKCRACRETFAPAKSLQIACSPKCALDLVAKKRERERKSIQQRERKEIKARKEKLKSRADHVKDAEKAVRDYRRTYELSIGSGCISCGKTQSEVQESQGWKTGGAWDGGHFLGKGARPELRLEPANIWLQCKGCNAGSSKYARKGLTVSQGFRAGLVERIGLEAVEALETDNDPRRYTIDDLKEITAKYRAKVRELKRLAQCPAT